MKDKADLEIINYVLGGDVNAFETIIERYKAQIFRIVSSHIPNDDVETVANDIFFKAFKSLSTFRNNSPLIHWLSVIAVRACKDFWRLNYADKSSTFSTFSEEFESVLENFTESVSPEEIILNNERLEELRKAVDTLKDNERTVINMLYIEGRQVNDTADILGMSESNIKVLAFRARKKLAALLSNYCGG